MIDAPAVRLTLMGAMLILSALFSGAESAFFSLTREQLRNLRGVPRLLSRTVVRLRRRPNELLTALLLGNTCVNIFYYALSYQLSAEIARESRAMSAAVGALSVMTLLVLSEVSPKGIAVRRPLAFAHAAALPITWFMWIGTPLIWVFSWVGRGAAGLFPPRPEDETHVSTDELKMLVDLSQKQGIINRGARRMISAVVELGDRMIREVMVPRVDVVLFDLDDPPEQFMELVRRTKHKRIPVYRDSMDNMLGIVLARDVFLHPDDPIERHVQQVPFVPETKTTESTLRAFRESSHQLAIVVDEYGGTAGLITLEDLLEEVVGQIEDEFDEPEELVARRDENTYILSGDLRTHAWRDLFDLDLSSPDFETVGGFVISLLGRMPKPGDSVSYAGIEFTVESVAGHRVDRVRVHVPHAAREEGPTHA